MSEHHSNGVNGGAYAEGMEGAVQAVLRIAESVVTGASFDEMAKSVVDALNACMAADYSVLRLADEAAAGLRLVAASGNTSQPMPVDALIGYQQWTLPTVAHRSRTPIVANDYASHPLAEAELVAQGVKSVMATPVGGEQPMVLALYSQKGDHFNAERQRLAVLLAESVGSLFHRAQSQRRHVHLRLLEEELDFFVGMAAHALRTPLTTILGFSELLQKNDAPEQKRADWLAQIHRDAMRLSQMLDVLFDLYNLRAGRQQLTLAPIDLRKPLLEALEQLTPKGGPRLHTTISDDLPPVLGDHRRLKEVFSNLLENAMRYTPENGTITVSARHDVPAGRVQVTVQDTGVGIAERDQNLVFLAFYRARGQQSYDIPGSGLGLYAVRTLVESMGGSVSVTSEVNKGSSFLVSLPAIRHVRA